MIFTTIHKKLWSIKISSNYKIYHCFHHSSYFNWTFGFAFFFVNAYFNPLFLNIASFSSKYIVFGFSTFFYYNKFFVLITTLFDVDFADVIFLVSIDFTTGFFYSWTLELYKLLSLFSLRFLAVDSRFCVSLRKGI